MKKLFLALMMFAPLAAFAQKFGHVNSQEIIQVMPEYNKAKTEIDALTKQYEDDLKSMQDELNRKSQAYDSTRATLPENIRQRREMELQEMYQKIQQSYQDNQQALAKASQEKMQVLERMITDALQIEQYDFASLVYVRELLEIEAVKLCARNRTVEDLAVIEAALKECEEKFYTDERVSKDFAYHQALARGAHNPVIASLLLVITPDVLRYYQRYRVCSVPSEEVCFEHRELLRYVREQDEEGVAEMLRRHLKSLREFAATSNDQNHFLE